MFNKPGRERGGGSRCSQVDPRCISRIVFLPQRSVAHYSCLLLYLGFELIDMSSHLPGLLYRPGLTSWKPTVTSEINTEFATYNDYIQSLNESQRESSKMLESHWPPSPEEAESLHLSRWYAHLPCTPDINGTDPQPLACGSTHTCRIRVVSSLQFCRRNLQLLGHLLQPILPTRCMSMHLLFVVR